MKTKVLKTGLFAVALALLTLSAYAQTPPTPTTNATLPTTDPPKADQEFTAAGTREAVDTVTVGSLMQYELEELAQHGIKVQYFWKFPFHTAAQAKDNVFKSWTAPSTTPTTPGPSGTTTKADASDLAGPPTQDNDWWFKNNAILTYMPATTGSQNLTVNVRYTNDATALCGGGTSDAIEYPIYVIDKPKMEWFGDKKFGACEDTDVVIPDANAKATGRPVFEIQYKITFYAEYDVDGDPVASSKGAEKTQWITLTGDKMAFPASEFLTGAGNNGSGPGLYQIHVLNITDRISRKSLDKNAVASVVGTDVPSDPFNLYIYAKPDPSKIKLFHVKNMPL